MAYLGRGLDKISNIEVLDNITFDGSSSYSITKGSVAFTPNSAQSCLISIDGVVQATNFTVSSSTINFGVAIPSTSTCNFFLHYGTGVMTVPSDGSVTTAKLGNSAVDLTSKVTGALPVANGGTNLTSGFKNGITEADQWRLTANISSNTQPISSNLERVDDGTFAKIGTGMSVSSGYWSFPSTGLYLVITTLNSNDAQADNHVLLTRATQDNTNYDDVINVVSASVSNQHAQASGFGFINVTNTANVKIVFEATSIGAGNVIGDTNTNYTCFTFIRLGDSQ
jgi:hypothetical protein